MSKRFNPAAAVPQDASLGMQQPDSPPDVRVKEEASQPEDNVRLYLSEIGTVALLDKYGEVVLAKQMERGEGRMRKVLSRSSWLWRELIGTARSAQRQPADRAPADRGWCRS